MVDFQGPGVLSAVNARVDTDKKTGKKRIVIYSTNKCDPSFLLETIHISCCSDAYRGTNHTYGGIIIFGYDGKSEWTTANGTHCKTGYLVIKDTDCDSAPQKIFPDEPGQVHGAIYRMAFGESYTKVKVVGEGFGVDKGKFKENSGVFNCANDHYHDKSRGMNQDVRKCVEKVVESWKKDERRFTDHQNYDVDDLLKD